MVNISGHLSKIGLIVMSSLMLNTSFAGVVLTGTRVILADGQNEKTIHLQNVDSVPALVQIWLDDGDENSTLETSKAPFVVSPQIFRMEPNVGQTVRVRFTGADQVAQDKESLYYLNFVQYPASKKQEMDNNRLMVVFKNRIKVFYRPKNLVGNSAQTIEKLRFKFNSQSKQLSVTNPTAYFANVQEVRLLTSQNQLVVNRNQIIAPNSTVNWAANISEAAAKAAKVKVTLVNDYGATVIHEASLSP
ncbi:fimbrial biogenesis chaperone [Acinetobacter ursingii]|uniref:fimbrial biogenesis chaperone n=1 Tax=Acinetobacter ursingii TaxID=108980 RepID=UPI00124FD462|nr:molecular chaperone [Acinetobacter ursingii]MCU4609044.1 molecular chaperone [Acinetobacter ursingii]